MEIASNVQINVSQMVLLLILHELVFDKLNVSAYSKPFAKALPGPFSFPLGYGLLPGAFSGLAAKYLHAAAMLPE